VTGAVDHVGFNARLTPGGLAAQELATGRAWTYAEFDRAVGQAVTVLRELGVTPGDRVAVLAKNRVELIVLHLGCARLGAIFTPLNWRLSPTELAGLLADAEPKLLIGDGCLSDAGLSGLDLDAFAARREAAAAALTAPIPPDRVSLILYTSGTSGLPKGVMLSEAALAETAVNFSLLGRVTSQSVFLCDAPMFHVIGLITNIRPALMRGGACLVSDGFVPERTLARLGDPSLGVTHYFCVPQMAAALRASPQFDAARLRGLTGLFTGGAPHPAASIRSWIEDGVSIVDGYGMTEAGTIFGMPLDRELIAARAGSAGIAAPGVQTRIVDGAGRDLPPGQAGELWVKGRNLTTGYWRREAETRQAFTDDGWLRTGDVAVADAEGYHWLVDRLKDMFISGGENVYPAEIESALAGHPGLVECAVVGAPDDRWGEVGCLFLVPRAGFAFAEATLIEELSAKLARYKVPKRVVVLEALPRNGAGKVLKTELRAQLR
jgi:fatty-acyl-CoA synthase